MKFVLLILVSFILNGTICANIKDENSNPDKYTGVTETGNTIITTVSKTEYCAGDAVSLTYSLTGTFKTGNMFTAQLSNASGSFSTPLPLGSVCSTASGNFNVSLPYDVPYGTGYRIRIISSNPVVTGCSNGNNIIINPIPSLFIDASDTAVCKGNAVTLTGKGACCYSWTGGVIDGIGFVPSGTTTYTLIGTSAKGCINKATQTITVYPLPDNSILTNGPIVFCPCDSVKITAVSASMGDTYLWSTGEITQAIIIHKAGTYSVSIKNEQGCSSTSFPIEITVKGIQEDCNKDGVINYNDLSMILTKFDSFCSCLEDIDNDGKVTQSDLGRMLGRFGEICK